MCRTYVLPSATSRKEVPVLMQRQIKKRKTGKKKDDVEDDAPVVAADDASGLDKDTMDAIAQKRCV